MYKAKLRKCENYVVYVQQVDERKLLNLEHYCKLWHKLEYVLCMELGMMIMKIKTLRIHWEMHCIQKIDLQHILNHIFFLIYLRKRGSKEQGMNKKLTNQRNAIATLAL